MSEQEPLKVIAGQLDRPLIIGEIEIPCYVLEDETRVLTQTGFLEGLGRSGTPTSASGAEQFAKMPAFLRATNLKPFIDNTLTKSPTPVRFKLATGGKIALGYDAILLPEVCEVYLKARDAGALLASQAHTAAQAEILMRGFATVGVIALVDAATGHQRIREERALATILERFIAKELQPWTKTFDYEFYRQIFRLKGWPGPNGVARPSVIGHYTNDNDIVYSRLVPGVLKELRRVNPTLPSGKGRRNTHHHGLRPT